MSNDRKDRNDKNVLGNIVKSERFDQFYAKCFANGMDFNSDQGNAIKAEFLSADGEIAKLSARVAELDAQLRTTTLSYQDLEKDHGRLWKYAAEINTTYQDRGYWAWQEKDNDLETLTCPVLIPAETLRGLFAKVADSEARSQARPAFRKGKKIGEVDWNYDFRSHFDSYCTTKEIRDEMCANQMQRIREISDAFSQGKRVRVTNCGGWPLFGFGEMLDIGMYDGFRGCSPQPAVLMLATNCDREWIRLLSITGHKILEVSQS